MKVMTTLLCGGMLVMALACKADASADGVKSKSPVSADAESQESAVTATQNTEKQPPTPKRVASYCPVDKTISSGDSSTPEGTVFLAYVAALDGSAQAFEKFFSLFGAQHARNKKWIGEAQWSRIINHVRKYVPDSDKPSYVVCRKEEGPRPDVVKIFVQSNDPQKSDPPITLVKENGAWKIDVFTP